jgi:hypothetical protein
LTQCRSCRQQQQQQQQQQRLCLQLFSSDWTLPVPQNLFEQRGGAVIDSMPSYCQQQQQCLCLQLFSSDWKARAR